MGVGLAGGPVIFVFRLSAFIIQTFGVGRDRPVRMRQVDRFGAMTLS